MADFFEEECEGDTIKDISDGEQLGAWLRDKSGVKKSGETT